MIVSLTMIKTNLLTHETDPKIHVVAKYAHEADGLQWIRVQGKQVKIALTDPKAREYYNDTAWYYFVNDPMINKTEWIEVKHDHITLNSVAKNFHPDCDLTYVMRVQGYDETGHPMVLKSDCIKARLPKNLVNWYASRITGYVHLRPSAVRFV